MNSRPGLTAALFAGLLCLYTPTLQALESDASQPIRIEADAALVDESAGTSVYRGNVIIVQGTLKVTADEVEIFSADSEVVQIIARAGKGEDELAHYEQQTNENRDMVVANAKKITYLIQEKRLHLSGKAWLQQVDDTFSGELLYYDIDQGIVNLSSGNSKDRVNMTITPKNSGQ